ncbi:MAG: alpha/beta fold hydrolase [Nanoarchaeota archaeon]|nr:alpha/beta fold hydrolase [Nanoarchaeota archaeon]
MITKRIEFENKRKEILSGFLRIPDEEGTFPAVIICHTFHDNKDNELMFSLWDEMSRARFIALRFDFSGRGESQGDFKDLTISREVEDIQAAFELLDRMEQVDSKKICIIGHSMGAIDSIVYTSGNKRIKALITLAARADTKEFVDSYFDKYEQEEWRTKGYIQMSNFSEISSDFLKDAESYDLIERLRMIKCPILIIHGTDDTRVPFEDAKELFNHASEPKKLELIEGADHRFTAQAHREELIEILIDWILKVI